MKIFAYHKDGNEHQYEIITNDMHAAFTFIENYKGDDLGNDLIFEDFIIDMVATGCIIEHNKQ